MGSVSNRLDGSGRTALIIAFLFGFVRGFNAALLLIILAPSLIAPVWPAGQGAGMRRGRDV